MIKGNPLVSIIVPVYGVEAYLDQCIQQYYRTNISEY